MSVGSAKDFMLSQQFKALLDIPLTEPEPLIQGVVSQINGDLIIVKGLSARVGDICSVHLQNERSCEAEVIGFTQDTVSLMPLYPVDSLFAGCRVSRQSSRFQLPLGNVVCGRVLDGIGRPLDDGPAIAATHEASNGGKSAADPTEVNPLAKKPIDQPLDVGIRALNAVATIGCGQRIGLFAGSGVGKSMLLGMMTKFTSADKVVVALVGERGREVREFVEQILSEIGHKNYVVIVATADATPLMRKKAGLYATQIAERFRDQGDDVLLLFDSLTRFAQAQREMSLALGEPPASRGYPASVFVQIPQLVERAGNSESRGSITGFYTVLVEGDDLNDPVAESARAILDGHLILDRALAEEGVYPALDLARSVSRVMQQVTSIKHMDAARRVKQWISRYDSVKDLIRVGAYEAGRDLETDLAIKKQPKIRQFISQAVNESATFEQSIDYLLGLLEEQTPNTLATGGIQHGAAQNASGSLESMRDVINEELTTHPSITDTRAP